MIRTARRQPAPEKHLPDRQLTCWGKNPPCDAVSFETSDGHVFIFPKSQLICAEYSGLAQIESIRLTFSIHQVRLSGHGLRSLLEGFQTGSVSWVKCFSGGFDALIRAEAGHVTAIKISLNEKASDSGGYVSTTDPTTEKCCPL
jgi:hypothetical protein